MRIIGAIILFSIGVASCVPAKKYNELLEKEQQCSEELEKYKSDAFNFGSQVGELRAENAVLMKSLSELKADTTKLAHEYRVLRAKYDDLAALNESLETSYNKLRLMGASEVAQLKAQLEKDAIELQKKEDQLLEREKKIKAQEGKLAELNAIIKKQEDASRILKDKVAAALKNFTNQGLTVVEKDGKIYVNMEAKLLFKSGSTEVEPEGKKALIELAKVLQDESDLEIIVEGHTDTDAMHSSSHPSNNWELSVLRSTSVISIMTANSKMVPAHIMAAGRSEFHPVDPANKAKNRRIEIIISPDLDALYELIKE